MSVLLEFSMSPLGKSESVSEYVARSLDLVDRSGVSYRLGPMGTCLEGDWDTVFGVVKQCYEALREDCPRLSISIKVDAREGHDNRLQSKVESVQTKLGRPVQT